MADPNEVKCSLCAEQGLMFCNMSCLLPGFFAVPATQPEVDFLSMLRHRYQVPHYINRLRSIPPVARNLYLHGLMQEREYSIDFQMGSIAVINHQYTVMLAMAQQAAQYIVTIIDLTNENDELHGTINGLQQQVQGLQLTIQNLNATIQVLQNNEQNLNNTIAGLELHVQNLNANIAGLQQQVQGLQQEAQNQNATIAGLQQEAQNQNATIANLNGTIAGLQQEVQNLNATIAGLQQEAQNLNATIAGLEHDYQAVTNHVQQLGSLMPAGNLHLPNLQPGGIEVLQEDLKL